MLPITLDSCICVCAARDKLICVQDGRLTWCRPRCSLLIHHRTREAVKVTGKSRCCSIISHSCSNSIAFRCNTEYLSKISVGTDVFPSVGLYGRQTKGSGLCYQLWTGLKFRFHLREETQNGKVDTLFAFIGVFFSSADTFHVWCDFWSFKDGVVLLSITASLGDWTDCPENTRIWSTQEIVLEECV